MLVTEIPNGAVVSVGPLMGVNLGAVVTTDGLCTLYLDVDGVRPLELSSTAQVEQRGEVFYL